MSTKTSFKRIALVAASALAIAGFSAVPANAAATPSVAVAGGAGTGSAATGAPVVGTYQAITLTTGSADKIYTITSAGVGTISVPSIAAAIGAPSLATTGVTSTSATVFGSTTATDVPGAGTNLAFLGSETLAFSAFSATAGTQTITIKGNSSTAITATLTWGAAPALSTQYSTAFIGAGTGEDVAANATVVASSTAPAAATVGNKVANITVTTNSALATPITGQPISVSITGAGIVGIGLNTGGSAQGTSVSSSAATNAGVSEFEIGVWADGRSGVGTITISSGTTVLSTKTVTFYSAPAKAVATQIHKVGSTAGGLLGAVTAAADGGTTAGTGGAGTAYAYTVAVTDANGNPSANATVKAVSSNTAVIQSSSCTQSTSTPGTYNCDVITAAGSLSGQTATVTFQTSSTGSATNYDISANALTFAVGGAAFKAVLSTDLAVYNSLAPVKLILKVTDSSGNAARDVNLANMVTGAVSSVAMAGGDLATILAAAKNLIGGEATFTGIYAPATAGEFTITGTAITTDAVAITATSGGVSADETASLALDAANAATDAANNAYDEAQNATQAASDALAAVTALAAQVKTLIASVKKLTAAVAKLKK